MEMGLKFPSSELYPFLLRSVRRNVLPLGSTCNLSCSFCSNRFNPPGVKVLNVPLIPFSLLKEVIPFLDKDRKIIIGESATRVNEGEPLLHPQFLEVINQIRKYFPHTLIQITTNGLLLTEKLQEELRKLSPLELVISTNSFRAETRRDLLGDQDPQRILDNMEHLAMNGIPFQASFLLLSNFQMELPKAFQKVEELGADLIRVLLPGGSRLAPLELRKDLTFWQAQRKEIIQARRMLKTPLILEPPLIEDLKSEVEGVISGSPADKAGIEAGDVIISIDGYEPFSRCDAFYKVLSVASPLLGLLRGEKHLDLQIVKKKKESSGLVMANDLGSSELQAILNLPQKGRGAILTSELAFPMLSQALLKLRREIPIFPVKNIFFGGSIRVAGLLTLMDIEAFLNSRDLKRGELDWVALPTAIFEEGEDLRGQRPERLEAQFGLEVLLSS